MSFSRRSGPEQSKAAQLLGGWRASRCVIAALAVVLWCCAEWAPTASAARVIFVGRGGHVVVRSDPSVAWAFERETPIRRGLVDRVRTVRRAPEPDVRKVLVRLERTHQITKARFLADSRAYAAGVKEARRLRGARGEQLSGVLGDLDMMALNGALTASRLPALFLTLARNRGYWRAGPMLSFGQRVEFKGSELVWEYYPGQGLQLQQLASFSKADWLCTAGIAYAARCRSILSELVGVAVHRAGGLTWEYYFPFDGGAPPWTSAMSQGTALQALADAYKELGDQTYLRVAHRALAVFTQQPPTGVGVNTPRGIRFVQYSFAAHRDEEVINAFLQALIGLGDYARTSQDPVAQRLFEQGDTVARAELPSFDTGAWSLYQPGLEDSLSYHTLVTGFLHQLCSMTKGPIYCRTAAAFARDLKTPSALTPVTTHVKAERATEFSFLLSKISRVGITIRRNGRTFFLTSAPFAYGRHSFSIPPLKGSGTYTVELDATDLAGNYTDTSTRLRVSR